MREFFQGWKRKVGVVTLILACFVVGLWIRSLIVFDLIEVATWKHQAIALVTFPTFFAVFFDSDPDADFKPLMWTSKATANIKKDPLISLNYEEAYTSIKYRNHPFVIGPNQRLVRPKANPARLLIDLRIPYVSSIPLALLSAWLLLSKPRTRQPAPASEP